MEFFASFAIIISEDGVCATTREGGNYGLPGGKSEFGETPIETCLRESCEEGWEIEYFETPQIITEKEIEGKKIVWVLFPSGTKASKKEEYKEKDRGISPVFLSVDGIKNSGFGNESAIELALELLKKS